MVGEGHNEHILRARDDVDRALFLTSNKLGRYFSAGALIPLAAACEKKNVRATLLYSKLRGISRRSCLTQKKEARPIVLWPASVVLTTMVYCTIWPGRP